jgi:hypothetical protein
VYIYIYIQQRKQLIRTDDVRRLKSLLITQKYKVQQHTAPKEDTPTRLQFKKRAQTKRTKCEVKSTKELRSFKSRNQAICCKGVPRCFCNTIADYGGGIMTLFCRVSHRFRSVSLRHSIININLVSCHRFKSLELTGKSIF